MFKRAILNIFAMISNHFKLGRIGSAHERNFVDDQLGRILIFQGKTTCWRVISSVVKMVTLEEIWPLMSLSDRHFCKRY